VLVPLRAVRFVHTASKDCVRIAGQIVGVVPLNSDRRVVAAVRMAVVDAVRVAVVDVVRMAVVDVVRTVVDHHGTVVGVDSASCVAFSSFPFSVYVLFFVVSHAVFFPSSFFFRDR